MAFITLVPKIDAATIQSRLPLDTHEQCLSYYFHNQLWDHTSVATIKGAAFNQVNTVYIIIICPLSENSVSVAILAQSQLLHLLLKLRTVHRRCLHNVTSTKIEVLLLLKQNYL